MCLFEHFWSEKFHCGFWFLPKGMDFVYYFSVKSHYLKPKLICSSPKLHFLFFMVFLLPAFLSHHHSLSMVFTKLSQCAFDALWCTAQDPNFQGAGAQLKCAHRCQASKMSYLSHFVPSPHSSVEFCVEEIYSATPSSSYTQVWYPLLNHMPLKFASHIPYYPVCAHYTVDLFILIPLLCLASLTQIKTYLLTRFSPIGDIYTCLLLALTDDDIDMPPGLVLHWVTRPCPCIIPITLQM